MFSDGYTLFVYYRPQVLYKFDFTEINVYVVLTIRMLMVIYLYQCTHALRNSHKILKNILLFNAFEHLARYTLSFVDIIL